MWHTFLSRGLDCSWLNLNLILNNSKSSNWKSLEKFVGDVRRSCYCRKVSMMISKIYIWYCWRQYSNFKNTRLFWQCYQRWCHPSSFFLPCFPVSDQLVFSAPPPPGLQRLAWAWAGVTHWPHLAMRAQHNSGHVWIVAFFKGPFLDKLLFVWY